MFAALLAISMAIVGATAAPASSVPGVVSIPFGKGLDPHPFEYEHSPLLTTIEIGSEKSKIEVQVDTGSFNLWVPLPSAQSGLLYYGTYDPSKSSSSVDIHESRNLLYGAKRNTGDVDFYNDTLTIASGLTVPSAIIGVSNGSNVNFPVWGFGSAEQDVGPAIISNLKADGHIKTNVLSFYEGNDYEGEILLGGIDHAKYEGELHTNKINGFGFTGTTFTILDETHEFNSKVIIDSGWNVAFGFPKQYSDQLQDAWKNASSADLCTGPSDLTFEISAENGLIKMSLLDLLRKKKEGGCYLDVGTVNDGMIVIGTKGFQHVYVSANFEEQTISFAKKIDTTESNIVAV